MNVGWMHGWSDGRIDVWMDGCNTDRQEALGSSCSQTEVSTVPSHCVTGSFMFVHLQRNTTVQCIIYAVCVPACDYCDYFSMIVIIDSQQPLLILGCQP